MELRYGLTLYLVTAVVGLTASGAVADSMTVPDVELREVGHARYELEVELMPEMVAALRLPLLPPQCEIEGPPSSTTDELVRWTLVLDCLDEPLGPRDVIVLPWGVDGIQLTALWEDGSARRVLFGRESAGVVVRLHLIMAPRDRFTDVALVFGAAGVGHFWAQWSHPLLIVALALFGRFAWLGLAGLVAGHASSLVVVELFGFTLPHGPAEAVVAGAAALMMAELVKRDGAPRGLWAMTCIVGFLHGLATAERLTLEGAPATHFVESLFSTQFGVDVSNLVVLVAALVSARLMAPLIERRRSWIGAALGTLAVVVGLGEMRQTLVASSDFGAGAPSFMEMDANRFAGTAAPAVTPPPPDQLTASGRLAAPFISYVIVEPYQIRHEVLVEVSALGSWLQVPSESGRIPIDAQEALTAEAAQLISARSVVTIDGTAAPIAVESAELVTLGPAGVTTRPEPIPEPVETATLGVTLIYETAGLADTFSLEWGLFSDAVRSVPLTVTDPATVVETELDAARPRFEWLNTLGDFTLPDIEALAASAPRWPLASIALVLVGAGLLVRKRARATVVVCLVASYVLYPFVRVEAALPFVGNRIDRAEAARVVEGLLVNVYRSFDIHNEELIYDRLALTVSGDQLLDVYLESRRALELENRGGARVRIDDVAVQRVRDVRPDGMGGFELDAEWTVGGAVNHFGHIHFRQNRYDATITIVPLDGNWKIHRLELLEEQRVL